MNRLTLAKVEAATERFLAKRLKQNKPFQSFLKTNDFSKLQTLFRTAISDQAAYVAKYLPTLDEKFIKDDLEPLTPDQKAQISAWLERELPALPDLVSQEKLYDIFKSAFEFSVIAQYKRWGIVVKADNYMSFDLTNPQYIAMLKSQANYLLNRSSLDDTTLQQLINLIEDGKLDGLTIDEVADEITSSFDDISDRRAMMIARTETAQAMGSGNLATMKENGVQTKHWVLAGGKPCEICIGNADDGSIPVDAEFSSGDQAEPAHPNCECYTEADEIDLDSIDIWSGE